jgi:hypothetical protein
MNSPGKYLSIIAIIIVVISLLLGVLSNTDLLNVGSVGNSNSKKQEYNDFTYMGETYRISFRNKEHDYKIVRIDDQTFAVCKQDGTPLLSSCKFVNEMPLPITTLENKRSLDISRDIREANFRIRLMRDKSNAYYPNTTFVIMTFTQTYDMIYCETDLPYEEVNLIVESLYIY